MPSSKYIPLLYIHPYDCRWCTIYWHYIIMLYTKKKWWARISKIAYSLSRMTSAMLAKGVAHVMWAQWVPIQCPILMLQNLFDHHYSQFNLQSNENYAFFFSWVKTLVSFFGDAAHNLATQNSALSLFLTITRLWLPLITLFKVMEWGTVQLIEMHGQISSKVGAIRNQLTLCNRKTHSTASSITSTTQYIFAIWNLRIIENA